MTVKYLMYLMYVNKGFGEKKYLRGTQKTPNSLVKKHEVDTNPFRLPEFLQ